jgi:regulator of sigma D
MTHWLANQQWLIVGYSNVVATHHQLESMMTNIKAKNMK